MLKRHTFLVVIGLLLIAGITAYIIWPRERELVNDLRALPEVHQVEVLGTGSNGLVVLHLRDLRVMPEEFAKGYGFDYHKHLDTVEKVQADQMAILRHLSTHHGVKAVRCEGQTDQNGIELARRVLLLREVTRQQAKEGLILTDQQRELVQFTRLDIGAAGRLMESEEIDVRPLDDHAVLHDLIEKTPIVDGRFVFDPTLEEARVKAMIKYLPAPGFVVITLGGQHDLAPYLPEGTRYIKVTPRSFPGDRSSTLIPTPSLGGRPTPLVHD